MPIKQRVQSIWEENKLMSWCVILGIALFVSFGYVWKTQVHQSPQNVFWGMIDNSLVTNGVTRQVITPGESDSDVDQRIRLSFGATNAAFGVTKASQPGAEGQEEVVTENYGTPTTDYVRYSKITTQGKNSQGQPYDFSKIINIWGKSDGDQGQTATYFTESVFGLIPFANLDATRRQALVDFIKDHDVYTIDFDKVTIKDEGRKVYEYTVNVNPAAYISALQQLITLSGLPPVEGLDPSAYAGAQPVEVKVLVDVASRQLTAITYGEGQREERYSDQGLLVSVPEPTESISITELQSRLQAVQ
jgi:hypothetical protein